MKTILITVRRGSQTCDVELPVDLPLESVARGLAEGLGWTQDLPEGGCFEAELQPQGSLLDRKKTLAELQIGSGAVLVFRPVAPPGPAHALPSRVSPSVTGPPATLPAQDDGPVKGWRPL